MSNQIFYQYGNAEIQFIKIFVFAYLPLKLSGKLYYIFFQVFHQNI